MSNKKITDLTELTTPTTDDVFPIVDIATNTTQKVQVGNLPIQTAVTTALATKQATLVSGTNIKTINGTSVLGSGNIVTPTTSPSGVAGAIQFSNGSAFASDASNLFWDDTNDRLGIGLNNPTATGHFKGSGSTSATTSLLVQNSGGTAAFQIKDDMQVSLPSTASNNTLAIGGQVGTQKNGVGVGYSSGSSVVVRGGLFVNPNTDTVELYGGSNSIMSWVNGEVLFKNANNGATISNPSAIVTIDSTTKGFLPPRMTTILRDAISSPATGLLLYNTTTNKLQCYNGSTWNDLF